MIEKTHKNSPGISDRTTKEYYLLVDDHKVVGVCTSIESALYCAEVYAREKKAGRIEGKNIYIYDDSSGEHVISLEKVKRLKAKK